MSMLKHIPSEDELDILIDDDGNLFIFCKKQNKVWTGKLTANEIPKTALEAIKAPRVLRQMAKIDRAFLENYGMNADVIDTMLK